MLVAELIYFNFFIYIYLNSFTKVIFSFHCRFFSPFPFYSFVFQTKVWMRSGSLSRSRLQTVCINSICNSGGFNSLTWRLSFSNNRSSISDHSLFLEMCVTEANCCSADDTALPVSVMVIDTRGIH